MVTIIIAFYNCCNNWIIICLGDGDAAEAETTYSPINGVLTIFPTLPRRYDKSIGDRALSL